MRSAKLKLSFDMLQWGSHFLLCFFFFSPFFFFLSTRLTRIARCKRKTRLYNGFKFVLKLVNMVASSGQLSCPLGMGAIWNDNEVHIFGFLLFLFTPFFSFLVHGSLGSSYTKEKKTGYILYSFWNDILASRKIYVSFWKNDKKIY